MSSGVRGTLKSLGFSQPGTDWFYRHVGKSMICMEIFCAAMILVRMAGAGADTYTLRLKDFCTIYFLDFGATFGKLYVFVVAKVFSTILAIVVGLTRTQF